MKYFLVLILSILFSVKLFSQDYKEVVSKGDSCRQQKDYYQAVLFYTKALEIKPIRLLEKQEDINTLWKLGACYNDLTEYQQALNCYLKFANLEFVKTNDSLLSITYNELARNYSALGQYNKAEECFEKSLDKVKDNTYEKAVALNNLADIYLSLEKYDKAKKYFLEALEYFEKFNSYDGILVTYINLGTIALEQGEVTKAEKFLIKAKEIAEENNDMNYQMISLVYLANYYIKVLEFEKAEQNLIQALEIAKKQRSTQYIAESYKGLIHLYETKKDYKRALENLKLLKSTNDSIFKLSSEREFKELESKYSIKEKAKENEMLKKEHSYTESRIEAQKKYIWALIGVVIFTILFIALFYYQRIKRTKARKLLEQQNKEIKKSQKQLKDLNYQYEKLIKKYEGKDS